jgi:hypothetical protein
LLVATTLLCTYLLKANDAGLVIAVFARMSQPSQPIRCAKKAIIRTDDVTVNPGEYSEEKFKYVFSGYEWFDREF